MTFFEWVQRNTGIFLLTALLLVMMAMVLHIIHYTDAENTTVNWIEGIVGQVLAALLTLLVGGGSRKQDTTVEMTGQAKTVTTTESTTK